MVIRHKTAPRLTIDSVHERLKQDDRERRIARAALSAVEAVPVSRRNDLLVDCTTVMVAIDELNLPKRNVRKSSAAQIARLRKSMEHFGVVGYALITHENEIVDGALSVMAARELGLTQYPCIRLPAHYDSTDVSRLRIALNKLQTLGEFDIPELKIELKALQAFDAPLELTGFALPELDQLLEEQIENTAEAVALEPEKTSPISRKGDLWRVGRHLLICGDALDAATYAILFRDGIKATFVFTDEPYNLKIADLVSTGHSEFAMASGEMSREEFAGFNAAWISACLAHLADGGLLASFIDWRSVEVLLAEARAQGLTLLQICVWVKTNAGQGSMWRSQHELLPLFKKGDGPHRNNIQLGKYGRYRSNVWTYPGATSLGSDARQGLKEHPTVKPTDLLQDAIFDVTDAGDVILEPFSGSGSTLIAAEKTGRVCRGIEIEPAYVDVALRRFFALSGEQPVLADTGETFEVVALRRQAEAIPQVSTLTVKPRVRVKAASNKEA